MNGRIHAALRQPRSLTGLSAELKGGRDRCFRFADLAIQDWDDELDLQLRAPDMNHPSRTPRSTRGTFARPQIELLQLRLAALASSSGAMWVMLGVLVSTGPARSAVRSRMLLAASSSSLKDTFFLRRGAVAACASSARSRSMARPRSSSSARHAALVVRRRNLSTQPHAQPPPPLLSLPPAPPQLLAMPLQLPPPLYRRCCAPESPEVGSARGPLARCSCSGRGAIGGHAGQETREGASTALRDDAPIP